MPFTYFLDDARKRLIATATGVLNLDDLMGLVTHQDAVGAWSYAVLLDASHAESLTLQASGVGQLIAHVSVVARGRPRGAVAVAAGPDVLFGMTRMYQIRLDGTQLFPIEVFRSRAEAEAWLDSIGV